MERTLKFNIEFNVKILQYAINKVNFLGFIFNKQGVTS